MDSNMSQVDWDRVQQEWEESFKSLHPSPEEFNRLYLQEPKPQTYVKNYLRKVGRGTRKARFFLTEDGIAGDFGFWCPKSAIVSDSGTEVEIADWCEVTIIEYNRN